MKTINNTPAQTNANSNNAARMISTAIGKLLLLATLMLMAVLPSNAQNKVAEVKMDDIVYNIYDNGTASVKYILFPESYERAAYLQDFVKYEGRNYVVTTVECKDNGKHTHLSLQPCYVNPLKLPSKLTEIKEYSFVGLKGIYGVTRRWNNGSFTVEFPASLRIIGQHAFEKNELDTINLPENLDSLGEYAFHNSVELRTLTIGNKLRNIPSFAFSDSPNLVTLTLGNSIETIDSWAFMNSKKINQLNLPNSLKTIGVEAFAGIDSLRQVTLPAGIESVKKYAFGSCPNLVLITFSGNVPNFPRGTFDKNPGLIFMQVLSATPQKLSKAIPGCESRTLIVPDKALEAYENAEYWKNFKEILPASAISFDGNTLNLIYNGLRLQQKMNNRSWIVTGTVDCWTSLDIPSEVLGLPVTHIADNAFSNNYWIESINLPETLISIGYRAFYGLGKLHSVVMPESLQDVKPEAFGGTSINNAVINNNAVLKSKCFDSYLETVTFGENVSEMPDDIFRGYYNIKAITFKGNKITRIGSRAFYGTKLSKVEIPEGVTSIGSEAFSGNWTIVELSLPESLQQIDKRAFEIQDNIKVIINNASIPASVGSAAFNKEVLANATLYVHSNFEYWYKGDEYWGQFQNIELIEGESKVKGFSLGSDDDNVTGIEESLVPERSASSAAYNIAGQSANVNNVHGIVIKNGKKMMMR